MKTKNNNTKGIPYEAVYPTYLKHNPNGSVPNSCRQQEDGSWEVMNSHQDDQCLAVIGPDGTVRLTSFGEISPTKLVRLQVWQKIVSVVSQEVTIQVPHSATQEEIEALDLSCFEGLVPEPELTVKNGSYLMMESCDPDSCDFEGVAFTGDPFNAVFQRDKTGNLMAVAEIEE